MTVKKARRHFARVMRDDPQFKWALQEMIAREITEDQRKADKADVRSMPSCIILAGKILDLIG